PKTEISKWTVQFEISVFGFQMQDSSNLHFPRTPTRDLFSPSLFPVTLCLLQGYRHYDDNPGRSSLCAADSPPQSPVHNRGDFLAGAGNRRQYGDLHLDGSDCAAEAADQRSR